MLYHAIVSTWILQDTLAIFWLSTKCRPTIDRALTNYWSIHRWSIDKLWAKCPWSIGERKAISAETHLEWLSIVSRPSVVPLSSESRPTIDRLSTAISTESRPTIDRLSTECRPTIDRVSTDYRSLYRPIDRSTLPTVNMILYLVYCRNLLTSRRKWYQTSQVIFLC